jgi:hypothetical protein
MRRATLSNLAYLFLFGLLCAQAQAHRAAEASPFELMQTVCKIPLHPDLKLLSEEVAKDLAKLTSADALSYFCLAERMERLGDYRAAEFYEKAIQADPTEPNYDLFYGDYLRNIRGASIYNLFPQAEEHYYAALGKLSPEPRSHADQDTYLFILRGLSALYQRDGVALITRSPGFSNEGVSSGIPVMSLASVNRVSQGPADLDREAYIRDYTSDALFAQSCAIPGILGTGRLCRSLTDDELRALVRQKTAFETLDTLRFRYKAWPVFDLFYTHRQTSNDQVTNFYCPTRTSASGCSDNGLPLFNDLRLNTLGVSVQKPFTAFRMFDVSVSGVIDGVHRYGLIEFFPNAEEKLMEYGSQLDVSHFFGPDKGTATVGYTYQTIHPQHCAGNVSASNICVPDGTFPNRYRQFLNGTLDYQLFRPLPFIQTAYDRRFENRGWDFYAGFLNDNEKYPPLHTIRNDYFLGTSYRGFAGGRFDVTVQPTWFNSWVTGYSSQSNRQYVTNANVLYRIVDEERNAGVTTAASGVHLAFLHLVVPFNSDVAQVGLNAYENRNTGVQLDSKFFTYSRWTTFFASAGYQHVDFHQLNKESNGFVFAFSMGF